MGLSANNEDSDVSTSSSTTRSDIVTAATSAGSLPLSATKDLPLMSSHPPSSKEARNDEQDELQPGNLSASDDEKPRFRVPGLIYRDEYRYGDGQLAKFEEKEDALELASSSNQGDASNVVLKIVTTYTSNTAEKATSEKEEKDESSNTTPDAKKASSVPEEFNRSYVLSRKMTIISRKLINALRDVITYYPGLNLLGDQIDVPEPYRVLVHYRDDLDAYKTNHPRSHSLSYRSECNKHIDLLLEFLEWYSGKAIRDEMERWKRDVPVCTFENLWLLYKPGEECYHQSDSGQFHPYITKVVIGGLESKSLTGYWVHAWNISFNGFELGRCIEYTYIAPFDGERELRSLKHYPVRFYIDDETDQKQYDGRSYRERLITRGKAFCELVKQRSSYRDYNGKSAASPFNEIRGRVVIDPLSYFEHVRDTMEKDDEDPQPELDGTSEDSVGESGLMGCMCQACLNQNRTIRLGRFQGYHEIDPSKDQTPKNEQFFFLCDHKINGMVLMTRSWETLNVECIVDTDFRRDAFNKLVLPPEVKGTLEAVSCSYARAKDNSKKLDADLIKGKGEGKIFLLHGPPGTGKTLSAEVVAELTERPLLSLTCGDLGTTAVDVEKNLNKYMSYGELWGAVVLLDEADIYLESRDLREVERNSLVSVFLRALEYYKGLLFLTTNRVNTFDEAFKSRIHVALEYKKLSDEDREQIWNNSMDKMSARVRVTKSARTYVCTDPEILSLEWNGREIRNSLQTALSLAEFQAEKEKTEDVTIKKTHLKQIVKLSASFKNYIASMHMGKSDSQIAKKQQLRNDSYGDPPSRPQRRNMFRDRYEEGEHDELHVSRTKVRAGRSVCEDEYEDERHRVQYRRTTKSAQRPVEEDDDEEEEDEQPKRRPKMIVQHPEDEDEDEDEQPRAKATKKKPRVSDQDHEDEQPKPKASKKKTPPNDLDDEEDLNVKLSKLPTRPAKSVSRSRNQQDSDDTPPKRRPKKTVDKDSEEEEE